MGLTTQAEQASGRFKLTKTKVEALPVPSEGQALYWDTDAKGFGVRVNATGTRSYIAQGRVNGKTRRFTIGPHGLLTCDEARKRALSTLLGMRDGVDPKAEKKRAAAHGVTLREVMADYLAHKRTKHGPLRPASKADIEKHVTKSFKDWADQPVVNITRDACVKTFRELSKGAPAQANQAFRNLRALLNWAREQNSTPEGEYPILPVNPVTAMFRSAQWNPEKPRRGRIPLDRVNAVWQMLRAAADPQTNADATCTAADLISFLLLTGARITEAASLRWEDVHLEDKVPSFRFGTTKNHNVITLPMSLQMVALLKGRLEQRRKSESYVFPSNGGTKAGHMKDPRAMFDRVSELAGLHISAHDLRRTFLSVAHALNIEIWRSELLTNHVSGTAGTVTVRHYTETSDLRYLLPEVQRIADHITTQVKEPDARTPGRDRVGLKRTPALAGDSAAPINYRH